MADGGRRQSPAGIPAVSTGNDVIPCDALSLSVRRLETSLNAQFKTKQKNNEKLDQTNDRGNVSPKKENVQNVLSAF